jgi:hypothetical protein
MAFIDGADRILYIKQEDVWLPIGCLSSNGFSESSEMLGSTTRDNTNGWKSSVPSNQTYSLSFEGLLGTVYSSTTVVTYYQLQIYKRLKDLIEWRVDDGLGNYDFGSGYISELSNTNLIDEFVSFSGVIVGAGIVSNDEVARLLLETGHFVLLETDDKILL